MASTGAFGDKIFRTLVLCAASSILLIVAAIFVMMVQSAMPTLERFGSGFFFGREWKPAQENFGALPFIYGTVVSSLIGLLLSVPISLGIAIFLVEQAPRKIARPIAFMVELLAAIPVTREVAELADGILRKAAGRLTLTEAIAVATACIEGAVLVHRNRQLASLPDTLLSQHALPFEA